MQAPPLPVPCLSAPRFAAVLIRALRSAEVFSHIDRSMILVWQTAVLADILFGKREGFAISMENVQQRPDCTQLPTKQCPEFCQSPMPEGFNVLLNYCLDSEGYGCLNSPSANASIHLDALVCPFVFNAGKHFDLLPCLDYDIHPKESEEPKDQTEIWATFGLQHQLSNMKIMLKDAVWENRSSTGPFVFLFNSQVFVY